MGYCSAASSGSGSESIQRELTPVDIPGADLREPFEAHSIPSLKWRLFMQRYCDTDIVEEDSAD